MILIEAFFPVLIACSENPIHCHMPLHVRVLGSSSAGNCTVVWDGTHALLVDCGFSPRYTFRNLRALGLGPTNLTGALITHTHADHFNERVLGFLCGVACSHLCSTKRGRRPDQTFAGCQDRCQ